MPGHCDKCGIEALGSEQFVEEHFPLTRRKRYCPACHQRLMHRFYIGLGIVIVVFAGIAAFGALRTKEPFSGLAMMFLVIVQWLMVVPHELGHAIAARMFGYSQIRILIGMGRPLFSFDLAGFYWVFNAIPFGGLTFAKPPGEVRRWNHLIFVSGGLAVNALVAVAAWPLIGPVGLLHGPWNVAKLLFWANVIVIADNLIPRAVQTSYGGTYTDGWQIWNILFRWNKPIRPGAERIPAWEVFLCYVLKWSVVLVLFGGMIFFLLVLFMPFLPSYRSTASLPLTVTVLWFALFITLAAVCGWYSWRVFKEPIAKVRKRNPIVSLMAEYGVAFTQEQFATYRQMAKLFQAHDFAQAEALVEQLMPAISDHKSDGYLQLLLIKLNCLVGQEQIERTEALCMEYVQQDVGKEQKMKVLDGTASYLLYQSSTSFLKQAERFARMGLEIAPGTLTLKGTLGSILVEQGNDAEAEPLLVECLERSPVLHDQAISSFYLGAIKLRAGDAKEGKRLINWGMKVYPEPWMVAKGNALLKTPETTTN